MIPGIKACKDAGYEAIDFFLGAVQDEPMEFQEAWIREALEAMDREGIKATQAHSYLLSTRLLTDEELPSYREKLQRSIVIASRLGIRNLVVHPLCFAAGRGIPYGESLDANTKFFSSLLEQLEEYDVVAALENLGNTEFDTAEHLSELYDAIGKPERFGFCWDTGHANLSPASKDCQAQSIMSLGSRLKCTHIQDNHGQKDEHILPMMGEIVWPPIVKALKTSGYQGDFTYETAQNVKFLPDDDILRKDMMAYTVRLGKYLLGMA